MRFRTTLQATVLGLPVAVPLFGCHMSGANMKIMRTAQMVRGGEPIRHVMSLYDQKPWLNLDRAGDRDPEGIHYRVFLDAGKNRGELREGEFLVELYVLTRTADGEVERRMFSDYVIPTSKALLLKSEVFGMGYHLHLRWAEKEIAGHEIEIITAFKDVAGGVTRSATKRIHVPSYGP